MSDDLDQPSEHERAAALWDDEHVRSRAAMLVGSTRETLGAAALRVEGLAAGMQDEPLDDAEELQFRRGFAAAMMVASLESMLAKSEQLFGDQWPAELVRATALAPLNEAMTMEPEEVMLRLAAAQRSVEAAHAGLYERLCAFDAGALGLGELLFSSEDVHRWLADGETEPGS